MNIAEGSSGITSCLRDTYLQYSWITYNCDSRPNTKNFLTAKILGSHLPGEAKDFRSLEISFLFLLSLSSCQNIDVCKQLRDLTIAV